MAGASSSSSTSPCAACKFLRRKCTTECVFAPYFPPEYPDRFANVHRTFGASNVTKILSDLPAGKDRQDAVNSLAFEAEARLKDPVQGCFGKICAAQRRIYELQQEINLLDKHIRRLQEKGVHLSDLETVNSTSDGADDDPSLGSRAD